VHSVDVEGGSVELLLAQDIAYTAYSFAVDDTHFYFTGSSNVYAAAKTGGVFEQLAGPVDGMSFRQALAVDGTYVYWTGWEGIYRVPKAGGETELWVMVCASHLWLDGETLYFGCSDFTGFGRRNVSEPPNLDFSFESVQSEGTPEEFTGDEDQLFFIDTLNVGGNYVGSVPKEGGDTVTLAELPAFGDSIAVDATRVFFGAQQGLYAVPKSGGARTVHAEFADTVTRLVVAGSFVFAYVINDGLYRVTLD
jgi:hypothetical protein